jgi:hypothetical protein
MEEFEKAANEGRNAAGLYHLGNFSHTCEDLFAHSNWVEMALGRLIKEKQVEIPAEVKGEVQARVDRGEPPIEDFAANAVDQAGNARPILATGTFTGSSRLGSMKGHDTLISISEEVKNLVEELNPFEETKEGASNWDFLLDVLNHMDAAGDEGTLGEIMLGVLDPVLKGIDAEAKKLTAPVDALPDKARDAAGGGLLGDVAAGAAGLVAKGAHAVVDPGAGMSKEAFQALVSGIANTIGKEGVSLAKIAVWVQKEEGAIEHAWKSLKEGVKKLPKALEELILPKLVEAEREFKKKVREIGSAAFKRGVRLVLGEITQQAPDAKVGGATIPTGSMHVEDTNVDAKFHAWAVELSEFMVKTLREVGGDRGAEWAKAVPAVGGEADKEQIAKLIAYAENDFPAHLRELVDKTKADAILKDTGTQAHQLEQISNVPEWARAGASHSQLAKDHATSPFFGLAFAVANAADVTLMGLMKANWGGQGPAPGMGDFGEKDASGTQKVGPDGRPVLKDDAGLSEWEKESRKRFLENRVEGEKTVKDGVAPDETLGSALGGMADRLLKIVEAYPILGGVFDGVVRLIRQNADGAEILKELEKADKKFDDYANSGKLDDDAMEEVDTLIARARTIITHKEEEEHEHGHGGVQVGDLHTKKQKETLDKYRGVDPKGKRRGLELGAVNKQAKVGDRTALDAKAEGERDPEKRFGLEVDRIFGHPYDTNWWVPIVQKWASSNQHVLGQYIRDRNAGKVEVH